MHKRSSDPAFVEKGRCGSRHSSKLQHSDLKVDNMNNDVMSVCLIEINEGKTPCSKSRPKEVAESIPVQNQAAAQKLLQKMSHTGRDDRYSRGGKHRGRG